MDISNLKYEDIIDVRDLIERVDELRQERDDAETVGEWEASDECGELAFLESVLADLEGNGGDEQWEGSWYPGTLIRDSYFGDYAQELAEDVCSDTISNASWPLTCIDWERAARELRMDYTSTEIDGVTYWYR
jgi:hypothetical protein